MSNNTLSINLTRDINLLLTQVESTILSAGGDFNGNNEKGQFSGKTALGKVKGEYTVSGQSITINITKKPGIVPMNKVLSKIHSYFSHND